ncbi:MAG: Hsp20/alpha crystallin family protein [Anaerolineae bacterium]|nr:Hsp20/alpha crystallin family protein [Anaerolineae bacterium]
MAETRELEVHEAEKQEINDSAAERTRDCACFIPRVDIYEMNDGVVIMADMPGIDENSLDISLEKNILTINGYVELEQPEGYELAYAEYRVGDYQRRFSLSNEIDQENIEAALKDGVLRLYLPKAQPTTRKIAVQAG